MGLENANDVMVPAARRWWRVVAGLILLGVGLAIFWPFVFGDGVLLYRDIGSDSLTSYYIDFVHLSKYIRSDGFPSWSFHVGMGQDLAYATAFLFLEPVTWLRLFDSESARSASATAFAPSRREGFGQVARIQALLLSAWTSSGLVSKARW